MTRKRQSGFSLVEMSVVTTMMAFLSIMLSSLWSSFGRAAVDTVAQARVVSAANMAVDSLRRDLGGSLPGANTGFSYMGVIVGQTVTSDKRLMLCFDGGAANEIADWSAPDTVIVYELRGDQLLRTNQQDGTTFVAAEKIAAFNPTQLSGGIRIEMTVEYRGFTRNYTLISSDL